MIPGFLNRYHVFLICAYFGVILFIAILSNSVSSGDDVLWINGHHSPMLDRFFVNVTNLGQGWIFVPLVVITLFIRFYYSIMCLTIWVMHGLVCSVLKRLIFSDVLRPTGVLDHASLYFIPGIDVHSLHSFPSGHTATAFCAAVFISLLIRHRLLSMVLILIALMVGYSRVYLLQHFLIDVAGGAFVGASIAFIGWKLFENLKSPAWMNQLLEIRIFLKRPSVP